MTKTNERRFVLTGGPGAGKTTLLAGLAAAEACCREPERRMSLDINENSRILVFGSEGATDPELYRSIIAGNDPEV